MLVGIPPFYNWEQNTQKMFNAIRDKEIAFSSKVVISTNAKDFITKVLFKKMGFNWLVTKEKLPREIGL